MPIFIGAAKTARCLLVGGLRPVVVRGLAGGSPSPPHGCSFEACRTSGGADQVAQGIATLRQGVLVGARIGMLVGMTRLTITVPDDLAGMIRVAGGENVSAWAARQLREALVREEARVIVEYERTHGDPDWDAERESMA
jgi:hypothetical protein